MMRLFTRALLLAAVMVWTVPAAWAQPSISHGPDFGTYSIGQVEIPLSATGGDGAPYTWAVAIGPLPPGISLRTDLPPGFPSNASAGLIGVATTPGLYPFTLSVTSGVQTTLQSFTLKISPLVFASPYQLPDGFVGSSYSYTLTAGGISGSFTWTQTGGLPSWMTLNSAGVLSGITPVAGNYNINFSVTDGVDTVSRNVYLNVSAIDISAVGIIAPGVLPNATQFAAYTAMLSATGGSGPYTFTFTGGGLPSGLSLDSLTDAITGVVTSGPGKWGFNVTATDSSLPTHLSYTKNMTIDVIGVPPTLPQVVPYGQHFDDCTIGASCKLGVSVNAGGTAPFTWTATGLPAGMSILFGSGNTAFWINPGDAEISGAPTDFGILGDGNFSVQVTVTDALGVTATNTFPLHVSRLMETSNLPNGTIGNPYSATFRVIGGSDGYTVALTGGHLPVGLGNPASTLVISGTPLENGNFTTTWQFTDSSGETLLVSRYLNINGNGGPSSININNGSDLGSINLNQFYSSQLSACCLPSFNWTVVSGSLPPGLTLTPGGILSGNPTASGTYNFLIQATDPADASKYGGRQFTMIVTPLSVTINTNLPYGNVDSPYSPQTLSASGGTGGITWTLAPSNYLPPGLTLSPGGIVSGTPTGSGQYFFTVNITDSAVPPHLLIRSFNISIYPPGVTPPVQHSQGPNLGTFSVGEVQRSLSASGGNGTYSWQVFSGSLPPGISLRTDGPSYFPLNASAGLIGVATAQGPYTFTLRVTSGSQSTDQTYTMRISPLILDDLYNLPDAFVTTPYSYQLSAAGNAGPVTWFATSGVPGGMTLSPAGVLSGTPSVSGFFNINLRLTDSVDTVYYYNVNLGVYDIQITTPAVLPNATQNAAYGPTTVTATGGSGPYTFSFSGGLPNGLTLSSSGTISGTPNTNTSPGKYGFTLTATDSGHTSYSKNMSIDVIGVPPTLPQIVPYGNFDDCTLFVRCERGISVNSGGTAPFTWTATGLPPGMSLRFGSGVGSNGFTGSNITPGDAELMGTPTAPGPFAVQLTVTDFTGASATNTFQLHVSELLQRDRPSGGNLSGGTRGVEYNETLRVIGGTVPYTVAQIGGQLPAGLTFDPATFLVSGTPTENGGNFSIVLLFTDSALHTLQSTNNLFINAGGSSTISINNNGNLGTVTLPTTGSSSYSNQLSACCVSNYSWSVQGGTLPSGFTLSSGGQLNGTLTPGLADTYTFLIRAANFSDPANNYGQRQFTLILTPLGSPTSSSLGFGNFGSAFNTTLQATGGTSPYTSTLAPFNYLPPGLTLNSNGLLSGTPTASGQYFFTVNITDADSPSHLLTRTFGISIYPAGANPPVSWTSLGSNFGPFTVGTVTIQLPSATGGVPFTGGVPPYQYSLSPSATPIPGMRVQNGPPLPTNFGSSIPAGYIGVMTTPGIYSTSIRVTDSIGGFFDRAITFTVSSLQILSQTSLPKATAGSFYSFTLTPYGGSNYFWSANNLPSWLSINSSSGQISGTPPLGTIGNVFQPSTGPTTNFALRDNSTLNQVSTGGWSLTVNPFAITASGILPQGSVGTAYSQTLDTSNNCGGGCTWTVTSGGLPGGLTLNAGCADNTLGPCSISGTPTSTFNSSFTIQASGSAGTVQKIFSLFVAGNPPQALSISNSSVFSVSTVGSGVAMALFPQGGTPPFTWSLVSGALPLGVSVQGQGDTLGSSLAPGFSYLWGRPREVGNYSFTLGVTDGGGGAPVTKAFTWYISPMAQSYFSLPLSGSSLNYNVEYTPQPLLALGGTGNYTWTNNAALPPGLTLSSTGLVSGTPSNTGSFSVPIQVTDTDGNFVLTNVNFSIAPTTLSFNLGANLGTFQQGSTQTFTVGLNGGTPPYTVTALTALPPGFSLVPPITTGNYSLLATMITPGNYSFTLRAQDSAGNFGVRTFTVVVAPFALLTSTSLPDGSVSVPYSRTLLTTDAPTWSVSPTSSLPPGLSVVAGVISGTPTLAGNYSFVLNATGSGVTTSSTFNLRISNISITDPQVLLQAAIVGVPFNYMFTAAGGGAVWSAAGLPGGFSIDFATGTLSGTTFSGGSTFSFVVTATPAGGVGVSRRFTLYTRFPNAGQLDYPIQSTALPDITVGQNSTFTLIPNNGTPPYTWSLAPGSSLPTGLNFVSASALSPAQTGNASSTTFAPGSTALAGIPTTVGHYTFDLIATDSVGAQVRRTFTLNVSSIGIQGGGLPNGQIGTSYSQRFTPFGGTSPYTFSLTPVGPLQDMLPPGLTFSSIDGLISGTPTSTGNYNFLLQAQDAGTTFVRSYSLQVNNSSGLRITNTNPPDVWLGSGRRSQQQLNTNSNSVFTWSVVGSLPPGLVLVSGAALGAPASTFLAGQPTATGTYTYTLRATETANSANFADHTFKIKVGSIQLVSPPVSLVRAGAGGGLPAGQVGASYSFTFKAAGGTPPYSFSQSPFTPLPAGVTLSSGGVLSGIPMAVGNYSIQPIISDAAGQTLASFGLPLVVTLAGTAAPLLPPGSGTAFPDDASVGVPYNAALNAFGVRGGVPPYSWSLASGSTLPSGMVFFAGSNGISAHLGGTPAVPGLYDFSLTVTDSNAQTLTVPFEINVSSLALSPDSLAPGTVGTSYSVSLAPAGGTSPYTMQVLPFFDMPPGLALSGGILAGTPARAGNFLIGLAVSDNAGRSLKKFYRMTVDNAAGEAPALSLAPRPVQVYTTSSIPAPVAISVNTTSGALPFNVAVSGILGATLSAANGTTSTAVNLNFSTLAVGSYSGFIGASASGSANLFDSVPVTVIVAAPPPCSYTLNPSAGSVPSGGGTGNFDVSAAAGCLWTTTVSVPWINITAGASGSGSGTVSYSVSSNSGGQRPGTITVHGTAPVTTKDYSITQFAAAGCSYGINPTSLSATAAGGTATISVNTSDTSCGWTASGLGASPGSGTGSGDVTVTVPPNSSAFSQMLTATIVDPTLTVVQTLTVFQSGVGCTVSLSPYGASSPAAGGSGSVIVMTPSGCTYDTTPGPSWISVTSGGSGAGPSGTLVYSVDPNSTTLLRTGTLTIGGQSFQITQDGLPCSVTVDTSGLGSPYGYPGGIGVGTIGVTANGPNCSWAASSEATWATLTSASGSGNGTIGVTISSTTTPRLTTLTVAGQTVPISQAGITCTYSLQSTTGSVPASGGSGSVGVVAPGSCLWSAVSNNPDWLTISASGTGGTSNVEFIALPNTGSSPRTGTLTIAGQTYTVTQAGAPCSYSLSAAGIPVVASGFTGTFGFSTGTSGCSPPTAVSFASWITVSTSFSGVSGSVGYIVVANEAGVSRVGIIQLGDQTFTVTQNASTGACAFSLNAYGAVFNLFGGSSSVLGSGSPAGCAPLTGTNQPSFVLLDPLLGPDLEIFTQPYSVVPFDSLTIAVRLANISFGGQIFRIKQMSW